MHVSRCLPDVVTPGVGVRIYMCVIHYVSFLDVLGSFGNMYRIHHFNNDGFYQIVTH